MTDQEKVEKYQDIYKEAWDRQNIIDRKANPLARGSSTMSRKSLTNAKRGTSTRIRTDKAPASSPDVDPKGRPLSKSAELVNKMMLTTDMTLVEMSEELRTSRHAVNYIKKRYGLPRT
tara:strand:- start:1959 stop:2312 length:354 start_codon:yes stop_codon:yes gene_type:complete